MGWRTLKERFGIERHIVQVTDKGICIGSGYVHNLLTVNPENGAIHENPTFKPFGQEAYPALMDATPQDRLDALNAEDVFSESIPVYTYEGSEILELQCEELGWPNVTHCGRVMYENTFSTDRDQVINWAKKSANARVNNSSEIVANIESDLAKWQARLAEDKEIVAQLERI